MTQKPSWNPWRDLKRLREDPIEFLREMQSAQGDFAEVRFYPHRLVLLSRLESIQHVLVENQANYVKSRAYEGLRAFLGDGLLTSEGDVWRKHRRLAQPAFHRERIARFADIIVGCAQDAIRPLAKSRHPFDLRDAMMRLTFRIVGLTLFGLELEKDASEFGHALGVALRFANDRAETLVHLPLWVPTAAHREFAVARRTLNRIVDDLIRRRRHQPAKEPDLLELLLCANDAESNESLNDREIRDEILTFLFAGHETTANALIWTFHLLSSHPECAARAKDEVVGTLAERAARFEDVAKLTYSERVIQESMRLYPPAWIFERRPLADDQLDGFLIRKDATVVVCPYLLHRDSRHWDEPQLFRPDRFLPDAIKQRSKYAYLPFGAGPRVCIGNMFALMEAKLILATFLQAGFVSIQQSAEIDPGVTLRPRTAVIARFAPGPLGGETPTKSGFIRSAV